MVPPTRCPYLCARRGADFPPLNSPSRRRRGRCGRRDDGGPNDAGQGVGQPLRLEAHARRHGLVVAVVVDRAPAGEEAQRGAAGGARVVAQRWREQGLDVGNGHAGRLQARSLAAVSLCRELFAQLEMGCRDRVCDVLQRRRHAAHALFQGAHASPGERVDGKCVRSRGDPELEREGMETAFGAGG